MGFKYYFIYKTTNLINGKFYIGRHQTKVFKDSYLGSGKYLKQSILKHGRKNFKRDVLEYCNSSEELVKREVFWIRKLDAVKRGYNCHDKSLGGYISKEVYDNISKNMKGVSKPPETIKKVIESKRRNGTLMHSLESKKKISETLKINNSELTSDELKLKHGMPAENNPMYGKKHSEEVILKLKKNAQNRPKGICQYCGKFGVIQSMKRYHFENCKYKNL